MKWTFAIRYLFSKKSHSLINIISWVSLLSIMVPTAAMVCLMSVYNGFENLIKDMYVHTDADIEITGANVSYLLLSDINDKGIIEKISSFESVKATSCVLEKDVLLEYGSRQKILRISGVDSTYLDVVPLMDAIIQGDLRIIYNQDDGLVLGKSTISDLGTGMVQSQKVTLHVMSKSSVGNLFRTLPLRKGVFNLTGAFSLDSQSELSHCYTSLAALKKVTGENDRISFIAVKKADDVHESTLKQQLQDVLGQDFRITTRNEKHAQYMAIMKYERWSIFLISFLILIIASLAVMGTMMILILEKQENMKTLLAIGASRDFIRSIFFREGLLLSLLGSLTGILIGIALCLVQIKTGFIEMPSDTFLVSAYPVKIIPWDVIVTEIAIMSILSLVAYISVKLTLKKL
ncbi:MAG: ABC transporter permease [Alistipes sp.]|nr:ABC transporter permease [Candidatus Alistipes equi]